MTKKELAAIEWNAWSTFLAPRRENVRMLCTQIRKADEALKGLLSQLPHLHTDGHGDTWELSPEHVAMLAAFRQEALGALLEEE